MSNFFERCRGNASSKFFFGCGGRVRKTPLDITSDIFNSELVEHQMLSNCIHDGNDGGALSSSFLVERLKAENARLSTAIQCLGPEEPLSHFFSGGKAAGN